MKKLLISLLLLFPLMFAACADNEEQTTEVETYPPLEITTSAAVSLNEMSPDSMDVTLPERIFVKVSAIDFDSFEEIDPKDSVFHDEGHDKVLDSGDAQYFFVNNDIKIHAVFFEKTEDGKREVVGSASYNIETGYLEFFGDESKTWYYNEKGELRCVVYTYSSGKTNAAPIYTFYDAEGNKDVTRTMGGWYSLNLDVLTDEEVMEYLNKYSYTVEATVKY